MSASPPQATLACELHTLEERLHATSTEAAAPVVEPLPSAITEDEAEALQQAAEEALELVAHERRLRMQLASKLRVLQTERSTDGNVLAELQQERALSSELSSELRQLRTKAQQASERQAASAHGARSERQQVRQHRRLVGARRLAILLAQFRGRALQRAFTAWGAKALADGLGGLGPPPLPPAAMVAAVEARAQREIAEDEHARTRHRASLDARTTECLRLREEGQRLQGQLAAAQQQVSALRRAAERATSASAELLAARREQAALASALAEAQSALERQRRERELWVPEDLDT